MFRYVSLRGLLLLVVLITQAAQAAETAVPRELEGWRDWVLQDEQFRKCPFLANQPPTNAGSFRCAWPERLVLDLDARGGSFTQRWQTFAEDWIRLPGDPENWPADVRVNGGIAPVVEHNGYPSVRVPAGTHTIAGRLSWSTRPESLAVDPRTAIVELTIDGKRIAQPERPDAAVW